MHFDSGLVVGFFKSGIYCGGTDDHVCPFSGR